MKNLLIILLVICNVVLLFLIYNTEMFSLQKQNVLSEFFSRDYMAIVEYDQSRAIDYSTTLRNANGDILSVSDVAGSGKKLIVRYSELNCQSCVDSLLFYAGQFANKVGCENVQVWATYSNRRNFSLTERLNKKAIDILDARDFSFGLDSINVPYMFILNSDMTISNVFIPHKEFPDSYDWYFSIVEKVLK